MVLLACLLGCAGPLACCLSVSCRGVLQGLCSGFPFSHPGAYLLCWLACPSLRLCCAVPALRCARRKDLAYLRVEKIKHIRKVFNERFAAYQQRIAQQKARKLKLSELKAERERLEIMKQQAEMVCGCEGGVRSVRGGAGGVRIWPAVPLSPAPLAPQCSRWRVLVAHCTRVTHSHSALLLLPLSLTPPACLSRLRACPSVSCLPACVPRQYNMAPEDFEQLHTQGTGAEAEAGAESGGERQERPEQETSRMSRDGGAGAGAGAGRGSRLRTIISEADSTAQRPSREES